jgi:Cys-tRNA(Pro) deacylase
MPKAKKLPSTPALRLLRAKKVPFEVHRYAYIERGGTAASAAALGIDPHRIIKTLIFEDADGAPLVILMHGDRSVSAKELARHIGSKSVRPCDPAVAQKHSGYLVGGTSPFATRRAMLLSSFLSSSCCRRPRGFGSSTTRGPEAPPGARQPPSAPITRPAAPARGRTTRTLSSKRTRATRAAAKSARAGAAPRPQAREGSQAGRAVPRMIRAAAAIMPTTAPRTPRSAPWTRRLERIWSRIWAAATVRRAGGKSPPSRSTPRSESAMATRLAASSSSAM